MARDEGWFDRLYRRHHAPVLAYCARRIGTTDAPDATSEVFAVAWRRREAMPAGTQQLPWLYGVARNVVLHHWRGASRARRLAEKVGAMRPAAVPLPDTLVVERSEYATVRSALAELRPADREVLMLSAWEGLSHREIAAVVGVSQAAVDKRMVRAKARLARQYEAINDHLVRSPRRAARREVAGDDS